MTPMRPSAVAFALAMLTMAPLGAAMRPSHLPSKSMARASRTSTLRMWTWPALSTVFQRGPTTEESAVVAEEGAEPRNSWVSTLQKLRPGDSSATEDDPSPTDRAATGKLLVVSNRLPFSVKATDEGYQFTMSSGGLVSAMLGVMEDDKMTWVGWPGVSAEDATERETIRSQLAENKCVPVFLDERTADEYYNGFCNSVLWPLFHCVQDVLDTNPLQAQWAAYVRANEAFCETLLPMIEENDTVWVHDYHLMLLPSMLKSKRPSLRVGWFLHTPFPTSEIFRMLPMREQLMKGLLGADLLGFHTTQYMRHFLAAAQRSTDAEVVSDSLRLRIPYDARDADGAAAASAPTGAGASAEGDEGAAEGGAKTAVPQGLLPRFKSRFSFSEGGGEGGAAAAAKAAGEPRGVWGGADAVDGADADAGTFAHTAHVGTFPIGIAPERFEEALKKGSCQQEIRDVNERFGGRKIMLGVDRLDPIKGIPHKLLAFEKLLETHPEYINEVVLVQIAVPSRLDVALHQQLQLRLHTLVGRINGRFGTLGWVPIHYMDTSIGFDSLVALYAASSAMVISSLRDGMNLVSFEWTVCQEHKPRPWNADVGAAPTEGVLVLSEFAGAADHLEDGALLVNPYDTAAMADALHNALSMPRARRQQLHKAANDFVTTSTAASWASKYVATLDKLHASSGLLPDASLTGMSALLALLDQQPRLAVFTDYDGTLTPIVSDPDTAQCSEEVRGQLQRLATAGIPTAIVSGRAREKIDHFVGVPELWVAGAHGLDIAGPAGSGVEMCVADEYRTALIAAAASVQLSLAAVDGAKVEDNRYAVSVHYRHVSDADLPAVEAAVARALREQPTLRRFGGKKVIEMRPAIEWNKGTAVNYILDQLDGNPHGGFEASDGAPIFPIYFGDDVSDEDAFRAVRAKGGLAVLISDAHVAREETSAAFRLHSPKQVLKLLSQLQARPASE